MRRRAARRGSRRQGDPLRHASDLSIGVPMRLKDLIDLEGRITPAARWCERAPLAGDATLARPG